MLLTDLNYAIRSLLKSPGFTTIALVTLTFGIAASTAMFAIVDSVLLRPLPFHQPDRLVHIYSTVREGDSTPVSASDFQDWQRLNHCFEDLTAGWQRDVAFQGSADSSQEISAATVLPNFFDVYGVRPIIGRIFQNQQQSPEKSVVISENFWTHQFARDRQILQRKIKLDGISYSIVGVMPGQFLPPNIRVDCWIPYLFTPVDLSSRYNSGWTVIGRLKKGVSITQASQQMQIVSDEIGKLYPLEAGGGAQLVPLSDELTGFAHNQLILLFGVVGCLTLIVCVNLSSLVLSRNTMRLREFSIRTALGAGRWQLIKQFLTETILLGCTAGIFGWLASAFVLRIFVSLGSSYLPKASTISISLTTFLFTFGLAFFTGIISGLLPARNLAFKATNDLQAILRNSTRSGTSASQQWLRNGLVLAEIVGSVVMLSCAGLLFHSFLTLQNTEIGLAEPTKILTAKLTLPQTLYPSDQDLIQFVRRLHDNLAVEPQIKSAGFINLAPLGGIHTPLSVNLPAQKNTPHAPLAEYRIVDGDYYKAAGIPLIAGRVFNQSDDQSDEIRAVVNVRLTSFYWKTATEAVGQIFETLDGHSVKIIGVTGNIRQTSLDQMPRAEFDLSFHSGLLLAHQLHTTLGGGNMMDSAFTTVVRSTDNKRSSALTTALRQAVHKIDPAMPIQDIRTINTIVDDSLASRKFVILLVGLFATVSLLLASFGLYGVISYNVSQRTCEYGVRLALGAQSHDILRLVIGTGMKLALLGIGLGLIVAFLIGQLLNSFLYGITPADPVTALCVTLLVAMIALLANFLPALRAMKIDPIRALREEFS